VVLGFCAMCASVPVVAQVADDDGSKLMMTAPVNGAAVDGRAIDLKCELTKGARRITRRCIWMGSMRRASRDPS